DAEDLLRTGVVGDPQSRLLLDHVPTPMSSFCSIGALHPVAEPIPCPRRGRGCVAPDSALRGILRPRTGQQSTVPASCQARSAGTGPVAVCVSWDSLMPHPRPERPTGPARAHA